MSVYVEEIPCDCCVVTYDCVSDECTEHEGPDGTYATLLDCQAACGSSWECVSGFDCIEVVGTLGTYASLEACQAACDGEDCCVEEPSATVAAVITIGATEYTGDLDQDGDVWGGTMCTEAPAGACGIVSDPGEVTMPDRGDGRVGHGWSMCYTVGDFFASAVFNIVRGGGDSEGIEIGVGFEGGPVYLDYFSGEFRLYGFVGGLWMESSAVGFPDSEDITLTLSRAGDDWTGVVQSTTLGTITLGPHTSVVPGNLTSVGVGDWKPSEGSSGTCSDVCVEVV